VDHKERLIRDAVTGLTAGNTLNEMSVKRVSQLDRELQELKEAYQQFDDDRMNFLEGWVAKAEGLQRGEYKLQGSHRFSIKVSVGHSYSDENGEEIDGNTVTLTPIIMRKAIKAWRAGKQFTPRSIFELFT